jgi:hypothetical protein
MTPTPSNDRHWDKAETAVTVAFLALFISFLNTVGMLVCMFKDRIVHHEANPTINVDTPQTDAELHDQRVREILNLEQRNARPELLPGPVGDDPSPASGDSGFASATGRATGAD